MARKKSDHDDEWTIRDYSRDQFYTHEDGESTNLQCRVSAALYGHVGRIVEGRLVPAYRTKADIVRDCLMHGLHYIATNVTHDELLLHAVEVEVTRDQWRWHKKRKEDGEQFISEAAIMVRSLMQDGQLARAWEEMERVGELAQGWSESHPALFTRMQQQIASWHDELRPSRSRVAS